MATGRKDRSLPALQLIGRNPLDWFASLPNPGPKDAASHWRFEPVFPGHVPVFPGHHPGFPGPAILFQGKPLVGPVNWLPKRNFRFATSRVSSTILIRDKSCGKRCFVAPGDNGQQLVARRAPWARWLPRVTEAAFATGRTKKAGGVQDWHASG